jgi:FMN phosphatase YigB (HAD superfamily)
MMQTQKIIIWDFNRTLYNPDTGTLIENAKEIVRYGFESGYVNILFSKNTIGQTTVDQLLSTFFLRAYFDAIIENPEKNINHLTAQLENYHLDKSNSFFISDRAWTDIPIGNTLGLRTVWFQNGKFAHEKPRAKLEQPRYIINTLSIFKNILQSKKD